MPFLASRMRDPLILLVGLAVVAVAAGEQDAGERRLAVGHVEIGRDVVPRPALEDDLLDAVAVALEGPHDVRVQRRPRGQVAERTEEERPQRLLARRDVLGRLDGGDGLAPGVECRRAWSSR